MSFLSNFKAALFQEGPGVAVRSSAAVALMASLNKHAIHYADADRDIFIEDVLDSADDGGFYRMEYHSLPDASKALAFVRSNPWDRKRPGAGLAYQEAHVSPSSGSICVGSSHTEILTDSIYGLDYVVKRARLWAVVFSAWQQCGRKHSFNDIAMGRVTL
jgi:hypothetical protein